MQDTLYQKVNAKIAQIQITEFGVFLTSSPKTKTTTKTMTQTKTQKTKERRGEVGIPSMLMHVYHRARDCNLRVGDYSCGKLGV